MTLSRTIALTCAAALAFAAPALGQGEDAVPLDNAGGGQYLPSVPDASGKKSEPEVATKKESGDGEKAAPVEQGPAQGGASAAAAAAAAATAPESEALEAAKRRSARRAERRREQRLERRERRARQREAEERLGSQSASAALPGSSEERLGAAFPAVLGVSLIATLAFAAWRRRRASGMGSRD